MSAATGPGGPPDPAAGLAPKNDVARRRFDAAAPSYEHYAGVQHAVADRLAQAIEGLCLPPRPRILEVGCGTGLLTRSLASRIAEADWTVTDLAPAMVRQVQGALQLGGSSRFLVMDGEYPAAHQAAEDRFDLICSSMALQWFTNPPLGMARLAQLLAPGGRLAAAIPIHGSCAEWDNAHRVLGLASAVIRFPSTSDLRPPAGFRQGDLRIELFTEECGTALNFLRRLKGIGATAPSPGSRPLSVGEMRQVCAAFERCGARCSYRIAFCIWHRDHDTDPQSA